MDLNKKRKRTNEYENERWSSLPALILWMVKDRLNLVDKSRLALVCKNWKIISNNYIQNLQPHSCIVPWLMHKPPKTTACEVVNISTMEKLILDLPEFDRILFSRKGWLLLGLEFSVVLFNVHNKAKIIMPRPQKYSGVNSHGSFSFSEDDTPHCVFLVTVQIHDCTSTIYLEIYMIGDGLWKTHSAIYVTSEVNRDYYLQAHVVQFNIFVVKDVVYIFDAWMNMIFFDVVNEEWRVTSMDRDTNRMMMLENAVIVQICGGYECGVLTCRSSTPPLRFYRLNDSKTSWEELEDKDFMGTRWYASASTYYDHFCINDNLGSKEVYLLSSHGSYKDISDDGSCVVKQFIQIHDLIRSSQKMVTVNWFEFKDTEDSFIEDGGLFSKQLPNVQWVDLGNIDKVPASCIGIRINKTVF